MLLYSFEVCRTVLLLVGNQYVMKKIFLLLAILGFSQLQAQDTNLAESQFRNTPFNLGIGYGVDYGGLGGRATYIVQNRVGLFLGLGYNFNSLGYNVGATFRMQPDKRVTPYFLLMYGYNGVIKVTGDIEFAETYYGVSTGIGIELKSKNQSKNFWNFELLVPFRDPAFQDDLDDLKNIGADFSVEPLPFSFSIGYHFGMK